MAAISIDDDDTSTDYEYLSSEDFVRDRVRLEYGFIEAPDLRSASLARSPGARRERPPGSDMSIDL
jgi:hypothetical protein